ncbi:MAG: hypothetical protein WBA22_00110 [Candidatus Methanofastidiosia archaeon]|jgi:hypothetical protein
MVCKCRIIDGEACPISIKEYNKCDYYDEGWCYYVGSVRKVE